MTFCGVLSRTPRHLPGHCCVIAVALSACEGAKGDFIPAVIRAASGDDGGSAVSCTVFSGHGFGGAAALLLSLQTAANWVIHASSFRSVRHSEITYGAPSVVDRAFSSVALAWGPAHTPYYVVVDPVAGLPRLWCAGLACSKSSDEFASLPAAAHVALTVKGRATPGTAAAPRVASLAVAGLAFSSHHPLDSNASCLSNHWSVGLKRKQMKEDSNWQWIFRRRSCQDSSSYPAWSLPSTRYGLSARLRSKRNIVPLPAHV